MKKRSQFIIVGLFLGVLTLVGLTQLPQLRSFASITPPGQPTDLTLVVRSNDIILSWNNGNGPTPTGYRVYRSTSINGPYKKINASRITRKTFTDNNAAKPGAEYWYRVTATRRLTNNGNRPPVTESIAAGPIHYAYADTTPSPAPSSSPSPIITPTPATSASPAASPSPLAGTGATFYVATNGSNTNNTCRDKARPCLTINYALTKVTAGHNDTISLANHGTYDGFRLTNFGQNLTDTEAQQKPLIITAEGSDIDFRANGQETINIFAQSVKGLALSNLVVKTAGRNNVRILDSNYVTISGGDYSHGTSACLLIVRTDNILIDSIAAHESEDQHGIYISDDSHQVTIRNSYIYGNGATGIQVNAEKLAGDSTDSSASNVLIENNVIYNNGRRGGSAINLLGAVDATIQNNLLLNNAATGIGVAWKDDGTSSSLIPKAGPKNVKLYHNTIIMKNGSRYAILFKDTSGLNEMKDNVIYQPDGKAIQYFNQDTPDAANVASNNNIIKQGSSIALYDASKKFLASDWQKGVSWTGKNNRQHSEHDQNSDTASLTGLTAVTSNTQLLSDPANGAITPTTLSQYRANLTTTATSANLGITRDILGKTRIRPTIGAFE